MSKGPYTDKQERRDTRLVVALPFLILLFIILLIVISNWPVFMYIIFG